MIDGLSYPPDKAVLIRRIKGAIDELNELEDETENSYRWWLVKRNVAKHKLPKPPLGGM